MDERLLDWHDCWNVRDLGGLVTADGHEIRRGALVRSDTVDRLTDIGWDALARHGVKTIVDLRNDDEINAALLPNGLKRIHLPLDAIEVTEFWDEWRSGAQFATPLYYGPHLQRFPERTARVLAAIAEAPPGGVLYHCMGGRDRTGQVTMAVLTLLGVEPQLIAEDYAISGERLRLRYKAHDDTEAVENFLAERGTTAADLVLQTLGEIDIVERMRAGGLTADHEARLRNRLLA